MVYYYLIAGQVLVGFFAAYVAGRKGRNRVFWWFFGTFVPGLGILLALAAPEKPAAVLSESAPWERPSAGRARSRPKRCCGSYMPDCFGCAHFRRHLFDPDPAEDKKGYCTFFGKHLLGVRREEGAKVVIEDR